MRHFLTHSRGSQCDVSADGLRDLKLVGGAHVRLAVVEHELTEHAAVERERHEREGTDFFAL